MLGKVIGKAIFERIQINSYFDKTILNYGAKQSLIALTIEIRCFRETNKLEVFALKM